MDLNKCQKVLGQIWPNKEAPQTPKWGMGWRPPRMAPKAGSVLSPQGGCAPSPLPRVWAAAGQGRRIWGRSHLPPEPI